MNSRPAWYRDGMKIMRAAALAGIAKKLYDESKKPENQARIKAAVDKAKARRNPPKH